MKIKEKDEAEREVEGDADEADTGGGEENDVADEVGEGLPECFLWTRLEPGRLHGVETRDENLDPGITGEADGVGLEGEGGLRGAGRAEGAVFVDELDDRLRDDGEPDRRGQREVKAKASACWRATAGSVTVAMATPKMPMGSWTRRKA
jgi:hypothetical protein